MSKGNKERTGRGWCGEKVLHKWLKLQKDQPLNSLANPGNELVFVNENQGITLQDWQKARIIAASLVKRLGKEYMPIFERVEREIEKAEKERDALAKIENLLQSSSKLKRDFIQI